MASYKAIQSEEITIDEASNEIVLSFSTKPSCLMVECRDKTGNTKEVNVKDNVIKAIGKAKLNIGDVIKYIAIL